MTPRDRNARRRARKGKGLLPPNNLQWEPEHNALDLREELGLPLDAKLDPLDTFKLLDGVEVMPFRNIPVAKIHLDRLRVPGSCSCSGFALPLGDGRAIVAYNDAHTKARRNATLMEEFFHLWLDHPPSVIRLHEESSAPNRSHDRTTETGAYSSGAAALVPYKPLRARVEDGQTMVEIARSFGVSKDLVSYRMKVTKLWRLKTAKVGLHQPRRP